jgi:hypothetical protein
MKHAIKVLILVVGIVSLQTPFAFSLDRSNELQSDSGNRMVLSAFYSKSPEYQGKSIYKSKFNLYDNRGAGISTLQVRDDFDGILIGLNEYRIFAPYGLQEVTLSSNMSTASRNVAVQSIYDQAIKAKKWIESLSCNYRVTAGNEEIVNQVWDYDQEEWSNQSSDVSSSVKSLQGLPGIGGTSAWWGPNGSGWSEEWFSNGVSVNFPSIDLANLVEGESTESLIETHIYVDKNEFPAEFGQGGNRLVSLNINCTNSWQSSWRLRVSKLFYLDILSAKVDPQLTLPKTSTVPIWEKAIQLNITSDSPSNIVITSTKPDTCVVLGSGVLLKKIGICPIKISQQTNEDFKAKQLIYKLEITSALICIKGNITKKVAGANAKCPAGYSRK